MLHHGRGIIYVTLTDERIRELGIPMIPEENSRLAGLLCGASFSVQLGRRARSLRTGTGPHDSGGDRRHDQT